MSNLGKEIFITITEDFIKQKLISNVISKVTYQRHSETIQQIKSTCSNFCNKPVGKIKTEDIMNAIPSIMEYSQSCIDKIWALLYNTFKVAVSRRKIIFNPMDDDFLLKPISEKETKIVESLTPEELKKLNYILDTTERNHKYRNIVKLQLLIGARIGEVLAISMNKIDLKKGLLEISDTLTKDDKHKLFLKGSTKNYDRRTGIDKGKRTLTMFTGVREVIEEALLKNGNLSNMHNLLFWDYKKNTFVTPYEINSWLYRLNEKYKISDKPLASHVLRHTRVTEWFKKGISFKVIQYWAGHVEGSTVTDKFYISLQEDFIQEELKKLI